MSFPVPSLPGRLFIALKCTRVGCFAVLQSRSETQRELSSMLGKVQFHPVPQRVSDELKVTATRAN
jgi:hypothetical protein